MLMRNSVYKRHVTPEAGMTVSLMTASANFRNKQKQGSENNIISYKKQLFSDPQVYI